jgi:hypothetical protein
VPWASVGANHLILLNDPPYGTERSYNGLRMAHALAKNDPAAEITVFLMAGRACSEDPKPARFAGCCMGETWIAASGRLAGNPIFGPLPHGQAVRFPQILLTKSGLPSADRRRRHAVPAERSHTRDS